MTQEELYEAIDATIAPNGQRGITAESLAALLKDIAANAGGSGQGALRVYTMQEQGLTLELLEQLNSMLPSMSPRVSALLEANAAVYNQIVTGLMAREPAPIVVLDMGMGGNVMLDAMAEMVGGKPDGFEDTMMWNNPVSVYARYTLEEGVETIEVRLIDSSTSQSSAPHKLAGWVLSADGSCVYTAATE